MNRMASSFVAVGLVALLGGAVVAQQNSASTARRTSSTQTKSTLSKADKSFMNKAAVGGMAEVELGRIAVQRGSSDGVKQFGQQMIDDHTKVNDELKQLASDRSVTLPATLDKKNQKLATRLASLSGAAFDRTYVKEMVEDHKKDVAEFRKVSRTAKDADLKAFAAKNLPTLEEHLKMAESLRSATSGKPSTSHVHTSGTSGGSK